jgi:hypothetical protein
MAKLAFKLPDGVKVVSTEIIGDDVVVTYEESKKLHLEVNLINNNLCIMYGNVHIGYITSDGMCNILHDGHRAVYLKWVADGMPVDNTEVEWRGKKYCIDKAFNLRCVSFRAFIFDFQLAIYYTNCNDSNIQRYPHSLTPIAY